MIVDYERAWVQLQELVASRTQHGREGLLTAMAEIAGRCQVPSGEFSRLLRLYGVEVERARSVSAEPDRSGVDGFAGGFGSSADRELAGHHRPGGHDGGSNGRARGS